MGLLSMTLFIWIQNLVSGASTKKIAIPVKITRYHIAVQRPKKVHVPHTVMHGRNIMTRQGFTDCPAKYDNS